MIVCPQITLIGQAAKKILKETGIMPAIEQADQRSNESEWARNTFVVASKQTSKWRSVRSGACSLLGVRRAAESSARVSTTSC